VLWRLPRAAFRALVVAAVAERRAAHEAALAALPAFAGLTAAVRVWRALCGWLVCAFGCVVFEAAERDIHHHPPPHTAHRRFSP
jgi:hypothetical protein